MTSRTASQAPFWIEPEADTRFPDPALALREPDGLLAIGGDLGVERLLAAYRSGIFPWYSDGQPVLWWSPDPRLVLHPDNLRVSRSLRKTLRQKPFRLSLDRDFSAVIQACARPREQGAGTWISPDMIAAYQALHERGYAHSVEAWQDNRLVGGLYGVAIGRAFFGESMFTLASNASKVAFVALVRQLSAWNFPLIDCQVHTGHLASLGAGFMKRRTFLAVLDELCGFSDAPSPWQFDSELETRLV